MRNNIYQQWHHQRPAWPDGMPDQASSIFHSRTPKSSEQDRGGLGELVQDQSGQLR